jgi:uncharacterized protein (DUF58 family)
MIPRETLKKIRAAIRRIDITTRRIVNETLAGQYTSAFKGKGMEFDSVREYVPGDDIRDIDWNVSARAGRPYTKKFSEERELTVLLVVDASASMDYGTSEQFKNEQIAEICALLAFSAIKNNDRVGLLMYTDEVELYIPPRKGRQHVLRLVRDVLFFEPEQKGSNLQHALEYLGGIQKKRAVIFVLSDFFDDGFYKPMQMLRQKHDVVALRSTDATEAGLHNVGLLRLRDPETGESVVVDTGSRRWREQFAELQEQHSARLERFFSSNGIDQLHVRAGESYENAIVNYFRKRAAKLR